MADEKKDYWDYGEEWGDWDLAGAIHYFGGIELVDVKQVLATHEGMNDERPWCWIVQTMQGFVWGEGMCNYTGWDSGGWFDVSPTFATVDEVLDAVPATYRDELQRQLVEGKHLSFRSRGLDNSY
jgi:hypothetical protein